MHNFNKILENTPLFQLEAFSKREAFLWITSTALNDSLSVSISILASKWKWHASKVKRFLTKLQEEELINKTIKSGKLCIIIHHSTEDLPTTYHNHQSDQNKTDNRPATTLGHTTVEDNGRPNPNHKCDDKQVILIDQTNNRLSSSIDSFALPVNSEPKKDQDLSDCQKQEKKKRSKKRKEIKTKEKYIPYRDIQKEKKFSKNIQANTGVGISDYKALAAQRGAKKSQTQNQIFQINLEDIAIWAKETLPFELDLGWELGKFEDYWNSIPKKPPKDGRAAFRNWLRKAVEIKIKNGDNNERFNYKNTKQRSQSTDFERFLTGGARALDEIGRD